MTGAPRYDRIGHGYSATRREDPLLRGRIAAVLGDGRTVVNVGAGAGSYEPCDRHVIAIEPSDVMAAQRPADLAPALRSTAAPLPLRDGAVDAAMAILTIHHWDEHQESGVRELRRVARGPVVVVTYDAEVWVEMWLSREYLPEAAALDRAAFPPIAELVEWLGVDRLGGSVEVEPILTTDDTPDWNLASFWAHPDRVLDERARSATSAFARLEPAVVAAVERDLADGTWGHRHGSLRRLDEYDVGIRLIVAHP